jgi:DNA-binding NarL/FixJ family response regulator
MVDHISVLVVDDHLVFADALQARLLAEPDIRPVVVAYGAAQARSHVTRIRPAVVLLDLLLGEGEGGLDLAAAIREISPHTRVVMLTALESSAHVVTGLQRGVRGWLPKTVAAEYVVRVVRGVHAGEAWLPPDLLGRVLDDLATPATSFRGPLARLTVRERQVLQCMVDGLTRTQIADRLNLSPNTVRTHTQNLIVKLDTHSALEAVALALRHGLRTAYRHAS